MLLTIFVNQSKQKLGLKEVSSKSTYHKFQLEETNK